MTSLENVIIGAINGEGRMEIHVIVMNSKGKQLQTNDHYNKHHKFSGSFSITGTSSGNIHVVDLLLEKSAARWLY